MSADDDARKQDARRARLQAVAGSYLRGRRERECCVVVAAPDEVPADVRFSTIWSNPPIRIG